MKFAVYKMLFNKFINEIWTYLIKLNQKLVMTQLNIDSLNISEHCFQMLLQALLKNYCIVHDDIDLQFIIMNKKLLKL